METATKAARRSTPSEADGSSTSKPHGLLIGDVARRVGLSLRTVRYYEEMGLVNPARRTQGGFRLYSEADVARFYVLKGMKPAGLTLEEIRELMALFDQPASRSAATRDPGELRAILGSLTKYEARVEESVDRLEQHLIEVRRLRSRIRERVAACQSRLLEFEQDAVDEDSNELEGSQREESGRLRRLS
jgi:DNA-binding transcriptional MerR regulator